MRDVSRERFRQLALERFEELGGTSMVVKKYGEPSRVISVKSVVMPTENKTADERLKYFLNALPPDVRLPLTILSVDTAGRSIDYYTYDLQSCEPTGCEFDPQFLTQVSREYFDSLDLAWRGEPPCDEMEVMTILEDRWYTFDYRARLTTLFNGTCAPTKISLEIIDPARTEWDRFVRGMNASPPPYLRRQTIYKRNLVLKGE